MSADRKRELRTLLKLELERQTQEHGLDAGGRVAWLLEQLENYILRWQALAVDSLPPHGDDLFRMIEVCTDSVSDELSALPRATVLARWERFLAELTATGADAASCKDRLSELLRDTRSACRGC